MSTQPEETSETRPTQDPTDLSSAPKPVAAGAPAAPVASTEPTEEEGEDEDADADGDAEEEPEEELSDAERAAPPMGEQKYMMPDRNTLICVYTKSGLRYGCGSALPLAQEAKVHEAVRLAQNVLYIKHFRGNEYLKDGYVVIYCSPQQEAAWHDCATIILRDADIDLMIYKINPDDMLNHIATLDKPFIENLIAMAKKAQEEQAKAEAARAQAKKKLSSPEDEGPPMSLRRLSEKKRANRDGSSFFTIRVRIDAETKRILEYHNNADKDLNPGKVIMTAVKQVYGPSVPPDRPPPEPKSEIGSLDILMIAGAQPMREKSS